jgi:hypothetical protein
MSERNETRDESNATPVAAEAAAPIVSDAPALAPVEKPEEAKADVKAPPVTQLPQTTPAAEPPPFLREHETRVVTTKATPKPAKATPKPAAAANDKPRSKFPLLAATLALAAAVGGAAGAVGVPTAISMVFAATPAPAGETADVQALKAVAAQLSSDIAALRAATEQSTKTTTTQLSKIGERLERAERAQAEPATKIAKIGEAVERLEKKAAAPAPAHGDVTGSVPPPEAKPKPVILEDYVVRKVFDGVALVEGRRGIIEVEPGATLPGAGRVEEIRRQDGRWVVVTSKGLIAPPR